jgi:pyruvate dehydrogenase E1 component beta subunit
VKVGTVIAVLDGEAEAAEPQPLPRRRPSPPNPIPAARKNRPTRRRIRSLRAMTSLIQDAPSADAPKAAMTTLTVREALRDAMAEEMRATSAFS